MKHRMGSFVVSSWKRLKVAEKMRRQEREAMGRDVLNRAGFIGIARDSVMIHFPRKKGAFPFQQPTQSGRGVEEPKGREFKRF
jgi:hypothetical protein